MLAAAAGSAGFARGGVRLAAVLVLAAASAPSTAHAIPAFARAYGVPCSSCHSFITRRHQFGDAFRKAGFHWPDAAEGASTEREPIELRGTAALAAWLPTTIPFSIEGATSVSVTTDDEVDPPLSFGTPNLQLLMGAAFGDHVSVFGTWTGTGPPTELYFHFARFADRPELNLRVGLFEQTTTLFKSNDQLIARFQHGSQPISGHVLSQPRLGVEANGVLSFLGDRTFWAAGVVQNDDFGSHFDGYYHLEQKIGGMTMLGQEPEIDLMAEPTFWENVHATIGHFGYLGRVRDLDGTDTHEIRRFGLEGRLYAHGLTLWGGAIVGFDEDLQTERDVLSLTWFVEAGYALTSWLAVQYAYQYLDSSDLEEERQQHDVGFVALITENVRARLKLSFSDDGVRNDRLEAQLLAAF